MIIGFDVKRFDKEKKLIPYSAAVAPLRIHVKLHDTGVKSLPTSISRDFFITADYVMIQKQ